MKIKNGWVITELPGGGSRYTPIEKLCPKRHVSNNDLFILVAAFSLIVGLTSGFSLGRIK